MKKATEIKLNFKNKKFDNVFITFTIVLVFSGLCIMYSSSNITAFREFQDPEYYLKKQFIWVLIGLVFFMFFANFPYTYLKEYSPLIILSSIILLILVFIPGISKTVSTYYGKSFHRWIAIGSYQLQPSEIAKLAIVIYLSSVFTKLTSKGTITFSLFILPSLLVFINITLILAEPALGTVIEIVLVILAYIFLFGFPLKQIFLGSLTTLPLLYFLIQKVGYRKKRIEVWLNPYQFRFDEGHQLVSSFRAFKEGGIFGNNLGSGFAHRYLTYSQTDFVMATFMEDFGFIGYLVLFSFLCYFIYWIYKQLLRIEDLFGFYLGFGILFMFGVQIIVNMFVITGIIPITGISFPFISYGGSSLVITLISFGILCNIIQIENLKS